jgi:transketolase
VISNTVSARISVDAAAIIGMRSFGLSATGKVVQAHFGFDVAVEATQWER